MDKIIERLNKMALAGDKAADAIFMAVDGMNQNELADYVAQHDKELRSLLGVKYLVEKDSNTDLAKAYFDLLKQGREQADPDKGTKQGIYNEKLRDIPYYMEKLGLPKEQGKYTSEAQAKFVSDIDKLDETELANMAWNEGYEGDAERMRDDIRRAGMMLQQSLNRQGYDPVTGDRDFVKTAVNVGAGLVAPRVHESHMAGQDASAADIAGDVIEGGLNFVPGFNVGAKGVRVGSKVLPKVADNLVTRIGAEALDAAAVPVGSQVADMYLYDKDDPRSKWDWGRVGAQFGGAAGAKGVLKMGARNVKDVAEQSGKAAAQGPVHAMAETIENIGNDARENIARRQLALERKAELAKQHDYNSQSFLTAKQNETGYFATPDDYIDAEDFAIRKAEAERFANTQKARKSYDNNGITSATDFEVADDGTVTILYNDGSSEIVNIDPAVIPQGQGAINNAIVEAYEKKYPGKSAETAQNAKIMSDYGNYKTLVQLPDGRFVKASSLTANDDVPVLHYNVFGENAMESPNINLLVNNEDITGKFTSRPLHAGSEDGPIIGQMTEKPRDYTVRRALESDPDFAAVAKGTAWKQPYINTATSGLFNAAAREGIVGAGLGLDEKRETALWNKQLSQLRPLVTGDQPLEQKRQMAGAIMNVMTYGLDNLPEEMFRKNPNAYKAIANQLGSSDWSHWSENKVPDYPTTSY